MEELQEVIAYFQEHERLLLSVIATLKMEARKLKEEAQTTPESSESI